MSLQVLKEYNGRQIRIRPSDRYVSLTDMAQASGKRLNNWLRSKSTKSYLEALSGSTRKSADQLIQVNESSGANEERGTWGHPKASLRFAQWCSDALAVQVDCWIDELLVTGTVSLNDSPTPQPSIPASGDSMMQLMQALKQQEQMMVLHNQAFAEMIQRSLEVERRQQELENQQREQSLALTEILEDKREAQEQLKALPAPTVEAPQMTMRAKVNQLVRNYVGRTNIPYREAWNRLYKEFFYRCSYNAVQRAKNRGLKKLDCIEQDGLMEQFYAIGCDVLAV